MMVMIGSPDEVERGLEEARLPLSCLLLLELLLFANRGHRIPRPLDQMMDESESNHQHYGCLLLLLLLSQWVVSWCVCI